jgi:NitT/TauT family transport system permease protein
MSSSDTTVTATSGPATPQPRRGAGSVAVQRILGVDKPVLVARIGVLLLGLLLWQLAVSQGWVLRLYAATPGETFSRLVSLVTTSSFYTHLSVTLQSTLGGWALGSSLGLVTGLILGRWRRLASVFDPYLTFLNATPKIALAPFFILWFGIGPPSKIVLAATIVFFIVQVPTQAAVALVNPDLDTVATTMGATELQKFRMVVLPGIMSSVFGALRLAMVYSLLAVVLGEFIASRQGLGQQLITSTNQFDMATAFALLIILSTLAVIINAGLAWVERRTMRWQTEARGAAAVTL